MPPRDPDKVRHTTARPKPAFLPMPDLEHRLMEAGGQEALEKIAFCQRNFIDCKPRHMPRFSGSVLQQSIPRGLADLGFININEGNVTCANGGAAIYTLTDTGWLNVGGKPFWMDQ